MITEAQAFEKIGRLVVALEAQALQIAGLREALQEVKDAAYHAVTEDK